MARLSDPDLEAPNPAMVGEVRSSLRRTAIEENLVQAGVPPDRRLVDATIALGEYGKDPAFRRAVSMMETLDAAVEERTPLQTIEDSFLAAPPVWVAWQAVRLGLTSLENTEDALMEGVGAALPLLPFGAAMAMWKRRAKRPGGAVKPLFEVPKDAFADQIAQARRAKAHEYTKLSAQETAAKQAVLDTDKTADPDGYKTAQDALTAIQRQRRKVASELDPSRTDRTVEGLMWEIRDAEDMGATPEYVEELRGKLTKAAAKAERVRLATEPVSNEELATTREILVTLRDNAYVSDTALGSAAEKLLKDQKVVLFRNKYTPPDAVVLKELPADAPLDLVQYRAATMLVNSLSKQFVALTQAYEESPTIALEREIKDRFTLLAPIAAVHARQEQRIGQMERAARGASAEYRAIRDVGAEMPKDLDIMALSQMINRVSGVVEPSKAMAALAEPGIFREVGRGARDAALQVYQNLLLNAFATPIWNLVSVTGYTAGKLNEMRVASKLMPEGFAPGEATTFAASLLQSYWKLLHNDRFARELWDAEAAELAQKTKIPERTAAGIVDEKLMARHALSESALHLTGGWGKAANAVDLAVNIPTTATMASDTVAKFAFKHAMIETLAYRQAWFQTKAILDRGGKLSENEFAEMLQAHKDGLMHDPNTKMMVDGRPVFIRDIANDEAAVAAMMGRIHDPRLRAIADGVSHSTVGQFVLPFFNVTARGMEMLLERLPLGAGRLLPAMRDDLAAGGERAAMARAKMNTGNWLFGVAAASHLIQVAQSNSGHKPPVGFTGTLSKDEQSSITGAVYPNEVLWVKDFSIPLAKLGVVGQAMGLVANATHLVNQMTMRERDPAEVLARMAIVMGNIAGNNVLYNDMGELMTALGTGDPERMKRFVSNRVTPGLQLGNTGKAIQDAIAQEKQFIDHQLSDLARHPIYNDWGDKVGQYTKYTWPIALLGATDDNAPDRDRKLRVVNTLFAAGVHIASPDRMMSVGAGASVRIGLTFEEYNEMRRAWGAERLNGRTLLEELERMVEMPGWAQRVDKPLPGTEAEHAPKIEKQVYATSYLAARRAALESYMFKQSPYAQELTTRYREAVYRSKEQLREQQERATATQNRGLTMFNFGGNQP
ncbi:hypothetical protein [Caudoviricetes sp.]|nr:hypothetical protein [Caudoviricetes sp.]UOF79659.1 hypothetical protein [Caudoviricetes sp.]UOF79866.1 hypothetical protein [Bacteriophage sp.]UOF81330.1 hypothetical protein [Caudoviricetes sp.]